MRFPSADLTSSSSESVCSRQLEFPATSRVTSGTESRFPDPYDDQDDIGNPGGRIPNSLSEHHGDEDAISFPGNPDIRVSEGMKRNDGLRAHGTLEEEDAGEDVSGERRRKREPERRPPTEEPKNSSVKDNATREESRSWDGVCSRQLEFPATSPVTSGTESQFPDPYDDQDDIGNPGGRIPDSLSEHHGDKDAIIFPGSSGFPRG
ncbi:hypothetical protein NDU88_005055 [Pleurodeles waltl]|uniref:Uncharacterized protein n=1 Tax=Pleurodeles waltl TaxID=8319 RepID=A0AAV7PJA8_PLEWA|nr:hypothetical protein NDU88_005055 [Pleurodeles waltl]